MPKSHTIKTIIFDLGGVFIDWNPDYLYRKTLTDAAERQFFYDNVCTSDWNLEQDAGRPIAEAIAVKIKEFPMWEEHIKDFYRRWTEMLGETNEETIALFKHLKAQKQYKIVALTNWSAETFPTALQLYPFLHEFDGTVVSGAEKTRKPYPEIYQILLKRYDITPQHAVFIDDNWDNIVAAEALGINAIHFKTTQQVIEDLNELGIK